MKNDTKKTLLLVEDEAILAMTEKMQLEKYGYYVLTVNTGEKAVVLSKENKDIDLILMDIDLGKGIDGTETAELILKDKDIPVVFLSSHIDLETVEKTEKITSYGYVVKSSSIVVMDASIKMAFKLFNAQIELNKRNMLIEAGNENLRVTVEELETGKNRLTSIFRAAPTGIGVVIDRNLVEINHRICEMTGYQEKELIGRTARFLYPTQEDFDFVGREKYAQIKHKGTGSVETRWKCRDGKIIDVLLSSTPLDPNDLDKGVTFTALDITERKQVEIALRESKQQYRSVLDNIPDLLYRTDLDGIITFVSPYVYQLSGYTVEEVIGMNIADEVYSITEERQLFLETLKKQGIIKSFKTHLKHKDGSILWTSTNAHYWKDDEGNIQGIEGIVWDITECIQMEEYLKESETNLNALINNRNDSIWSIDMNYNFIIFNKYFKKAYFSVFNIQLKKGMNALNILSPDLKDFWKQKYDKALKGEYISFEYSNQVDGKVHTFEVYFYPIINDNNKISGVSAISIDITERKQMEESFLKSEKRYKNDEKIAHIGNWEFNVATKKFWASDEAKRIFGFDTKILEASVDEVEKCIPERERVHQVLIDLIQGGKESELEFEIYPGNSVESRNIWSMAEIDRDENGVPLIVYGVIQNITDRKLAETEIQNQLLEKEIILKESHHRIKNNFATIVNLLSLQSNTLTNPEAISALNDAIGRVKSMQILYEKLLLTVDYKTTSIKTYLENLIDDLVQFFPKDIDIRIEKKIDDLQFDSKRLVSVGIIINELLTNIMKYAFTGKDSGLIEVVLKENKGNVILTVKDDGKGFPKGFDIAESTGFGLMLVKMLVKQLDGSLSMENNDGLKTIIKFCI